MPKFQSANKIQPVGAPVIVRPAPRGSKKGWVTVSGEVPPKVGEQWRALMDRRGCYQSALVHEAVVLLLENEARKGRRKTVGRRKYDSPTATAA